MTMMRALLLASTLSVLACGGSNPPAETAPAVASAAPAPPPPPPCKDGPVNPGEAMAKEPNVFAACLGGASKLTGNFCGQAKIAVEIGKDGRITRSEVASSTLPPGVTDCIKARLEAVQYACPKEGTATYTVPLGIPVGHPTGECPGLPGMAH
jgi:hypothetical protein